MGQLIGSFSAVSMMEKLGDIKTMAIGAVVCIPYISSLLFPAYKAGAIDAGDTSNPWYFNSIFVYIVIIFFSLFNGIGEGLA